MEEVFTIARPQRQINYYLYFSVCIFSGTKQKKKDETGWYVIWMRVIREYRRAAGKRAFRQHSSGFYLVYLSH